MSRGSRLVSSVVIGSTGAALVLGEVAERYDDAHRVTYAVQKLRKRQHDARVGPATAAGTSSRTADGIDVNDTLQQRQPSAHSPAGAAWLTHDNPKFPYLLGISSGDSVTKVVDTVLGGSSTTVTSSESSVAMLRDMLTPSSTLERVVNVVAQRWKTLKASLHPDLPAAFDPRASALSLSLDEVLRALNEVASAEDPAPAGLSLLTGDTNTSTDDSNEQTAGSQHPGDNQSPHTVERQSHLVFVLRDFDALNGPDAANWLQWTQQVTSAGLAHVVIPTRAGITPSKLEALQTLHGGANSDEFVAIVLRVARGAADTSSAMDKLRELEATYQLGLSARNPESGTADTDDDASAVALRVDEATVIADAAGNWWSDLAAICERLEQRELRAITDPLEREALVRVVCDEFRDHTMESVLRHVRLDGSLDLLRVASASKSSGGNGDYGSDAEDTVVAAAAAVAARLDTADEEQALRALETWKCLEVVTGLAAKSGVMASPQQFLMPDPNKPPLCAHPVAALLPFGHRREGEAKFLELIDDGAAVEIGVVPCAASDLIAPCWVETRPAIASAFTTLWRNDTYFHAVQELERIATTKTLRDEIALFAREIDERRQHLAEQRTEFVLMQSTLSKAERATRVAELSLLELEIQSKDVYLERMRTLLLS